MRVSVVLVFAILLGAGCAPAHGQTEPATATESAPPPQPQLIVKPSGPARISGAVIAGNMLTKTPPVYPAAARAAKIEGTVVLHAIIGKDGYVKNLTFVSGPPLLTPAALDAVKQWVYKPYLLNGQPTEVDTTIMVNFHLNKPLRRGTPADS